MKTKIGPPAFTEKGEEEAIRCVLDHVRTDISYGGGGTFTDGSNENNADEKEITKAQRGIQLIEWILEVIKDKSSP